MVKPSFYFARVSLGTRLPSAYVPSEAIITRGHVCSALRLHTFLHSLPLFLLEPELLASLTAHLVLVPLAQEATQLLTLVPGEVAMVTST